MCLHVSSQSFFEHWPDHPASLPCPGEWPLQPGSRPCLCLSDQQPQTLPVAPTCLGLCWQVGCAGRIETTPPAVQVLQGMPRCWRPDETAVLLEVGCWLACVTAMTAAPRQSGRACAGAGDLLCPAGEGPCALPC